MEVILLERVGRFGNMGDVVNVRPGFARNYLIPHHKALRATEENKKVFEARRSKLEADNAFRRKEAEGKAKKMEGLSLTLVRQASEDGKLFGSVSVRDIADELRNAGHEVERRMVHLKSTIKNTGAYTAEIELHPEVRVNVALKVVRNETDVIDTVEAIAALKAAEAAAEAQEETVEENETQEEKE